MVVINELITSAHKIYELTQSFINLDVRQRSILLPLHHHFPSRLLCQPL